MIKRYFENYFSRVKATKQVSKDGGINWLIPLLNSLLITVVVSFYLAQAVWFMLDIWQSAQTYEPWYMEYLWQFSSFSATIFMTIIVFTIQDKIIMFFIKLNSFMNNQIFKGISKIDMFGNVCKVKINDIDNELETFSKHVTNNSMFELFTSIKASKEKVLDLYDRQTINHVAQMIARIAMKYALGRDGHRSMKMTKDDLIQYIKDETADSPMNRFNNDFLKLQMNILSVWGLYTKINLLGEFDEKSETIFPEFTLDNVDTFKHSNYDNNILSGFSSIIKKNEEFEAKRVYNELL